LYTDQLLLTLWLTIEDHDTLFVLAELAHFVGIIILVYKLYRKKSVAGSHLLPPTCADSCSC
jgi:ER lumen protein retaining receptor